MESNLDGAATLRDGGGEAVGRDEATLCSAKDEKGDGLNVLSHVEALVNACFPENALDSGSGSGGFCEAGAEEDQSAGTEFIIFPKAEPDSTATSVPKVSPTVEKESTATETEAAHGTKRRLAAVDNGETEGEYASLADTKSSEPSSGDFGSFVGTAGASASASCPNLPTAQVCPQPAKKSEVNNVLDGIPTPGAESMPPENPMVRAVTRFLLDKVRQAASDSKLELRQTLKADLERFKSDLSLKDRSKMRSRREAAVSRESRIAYTKGLEELVLDLVRGNLLLLENRDMRPCADVRHVESGVNPYTTAAAQPVLAQTRNRSELSLQRGDVSCPTRAPGGAREKAEEIAVTSENLGVSKGHQRKEVEQ